MLISVDIMHFLFRTSLNCTLDREKRDQGRARSHSGETNKAESYGAVDDELEQNTSGFSLSTKAAPLWQGRKNNRLAMITSMISLNNKNHQRGPMTKAKSVVGRKRTMLKFLSR